MTSRSGAITMTGIHTGLSNRFTVRCAAAVGALLVGATAACSGGSTPPPAVATPPPAASAAPSSAAAPAGSTPAAETKVPAPAEPAQTGNPQRCTTAELAGSLGGGDAAAGSTYRALLLTNKGTRTCELRGYPGVSYVAGDDGHQVGPAAAMDGPRGGEVFIKPGQAVAAQLRLVNVLNYDEAACKPVPVRGLRVYPPGDTASLYIPMEGTGCSATPPGDQLSVQTVKPA
ncbi:DUF4232 domain-containing protein [Actinomycetes bacterium KLBMP 9759]